MFHRLRLFVGLNAGRSPKWRSVRKAWLKAHPKCAACGKKRLLEVHHVQPFHEHPELELDPTNFITLCQGIFGKHHLQLGHLGNWKNANPRVREDAADLLAKR